VFPVSETSSLTLWSNTAHKIANQLSSCRASVFVTTHAEARHVFTKHCCVMLCSDSLLVSWKRVQWQTV